MRSSLSAAALLALTAGACLGQGTMYVLNSNRNIYTVDINTAQVTQVGTVSAGGTVGGLAYDCATQTMYMTSTSGDALYRLDLTTFAATLIGSYSADVVMHGIEWDNSTNTLYGGSDGNLFTIDTTTGAATIIGNAGFGSFLNLGYHRGRNVMYGSNTQTDSLWIIDRATGAGTLVGPLNGPTNPHGFAYVPHLDELFLVCSTTEGLFTLDLDSGEVRTVGSLGSGNWLGLAWVPDTCAMPTVDARVSIAAPANCSIGQGQNATFTATVTNAATTPVTGATVTFTMPEGATFVSSNPPGTVIGNTVTANLGGLLPGESIGFPVTMTLNSPGLNTASATVSILQSDQVAANNTDSSSTSVQGPVAGTARAIFSNIAAQPNSEIPGMPGLRFGTGGFERPFRSPNGEWFTLGAFSNSGVTTADQLLLIGNTTNGQFTLAAAEGGTAPDGSSYGPFDIVSGINNAGHYVFSNNTSAPTSLDEVVVKWDGSQHTLVAGESAAIGGTGYFWGSTNGSASILGDGTFTVQSNFTGAPATSDTGVFRGETLVAQEGTTIPTGQIGGAQFTVKAFDGNTAGLGFFMSTDGAHYLWSGTVNDVTAQDKVVVVDNDVKIQEGTVIPGSGFTSTVSTVLFAMMESNGDWFAYGANLDGNDYAVRNGVVIGRTNSPITPGSTERWSSVPNTQTFTHLAGGPTGAYVIGGTTTGHHRANHVIVFNGETVIARENDAVDLNGDGQFNDGVFIHSFNDDFAFINGTDLYMTVQLRDESSAFGCSGTAPASIGEAFVRVALPTVNPCPGDQCGGQDFNGDGDFGTDQDIEAFFACLGGNCCSTCFCQGSDFNGDGDFGTDQDIEAFFRVLAGGTC